MYQRIMEILVLLMDELGNESWQVDQMDQVSENLIKRGYTEQEINTAFYWLHNRFNWSSKAPTHKVDISDPVSTSYRVLHTLEKKYLDPSAFGYLLQLKHLNLITSRELEEVIERLFIFDFQVASVEDVKAIVHSLLFEEGGGWTGNIRSFGLLDQGETYH